MAQMTTKDFATAIKLIDVLSKMSSDWFEPPVMNAPTMSELARIIEASDYSDDLFGAGILFGTRAHALRTIGTGEIVILGELTVEGIGRTPKQAMLNTLAGGDGEDIEDISDALRNLQGHPRTRWSTLEPMPKEDRGFFFRFNHVKKKWVDIEAGIKLHKLRRKVKLEFEALNTIARQGRRRGLQALIDSQSAYQNLYVQFQDTIRRAGLEAQLREAILLRQKAIENLEKAREAYVVAAKYQKIAAGLRMIGSLLETGALAGERVMSWQNASEAETHMRALQNDHDRWTFDIGELELRIDQLHPQINETSDQIDGLLRDSVPHAPLPAQPNESDDYIPDLA